MKLFYQTTIKELIRQWKDIQNMSSKKGLGDHVLLARVSELQKPPSYYSSNDNQKLKRRFWGEIYVFTFLFKTVLDF